MKVNVSKSNTAELLTYAQMSLEHGSIFRPVGEFTEYVFFPTSGHISAPDVVIYFTSSRAQLAKRDLWEDVMFERLSPREVVTIQNERKANS